MTINTGEKQMRNSTWQIAPVKRPLLSVSKLNDAGNDVIFSKKNPRIINEKTGQTTKILRNGNIFVIDVGIFVPEGF